MSEASVSVAILAGGAATRLGGRDKGLWPLLGVPLIERICHALASPGWRHPSGIAVDVLIVANRNLDEYARYARTIADGPDGGSGPLAGVASALRANTNRWLLTLPVDCPDPPPALLELLMRCIGGADCAVAHDGESRQPLFALYTGHLAESAIAAARKGWGPSRWQSTLQTVDVDLGDQRLHFANLNSPADFDGYREHRPPSP